MKGIRFDQRSLATLGAMLAILVVISMGPSRTTISAPLVGVTTDVDLSVEIRTLDTYVTDLVTLDRECAKLFNKASLSASEVAPVERRGDDLKRRLLEVQNALKEITRKLKAANQFDDLDAIVVARIKDQDLQNRFRRDSFKKLLEETPSQLGASAGDIVVGLEALHRKVSGESQEASARSFRLSNGTKCKLSKLRYGLSAMVSSSGLASSSSYLDVACYCDAITSACSFNH